jgi:hypothetical protein
VATSAADSVDKAGDAAARSAIEGSGGTGRGGGDDDVGVVVSITVGGAIGVGDSIAGLLSISAIVGAAVIDEVGVVVVVVVADTPVIVISCASQMIKPIQKRHAKLKHLLMKHCFIVCLYSVALRVVMGHHEAFFSDISDMTSEFCNSFSQYFLNLVHL